MDKRSILKRLKLIDYLTTEIPINKKDFVEKLKMNVDQGEISISFLEAFSSSKNEYKGLVTDESFKIRRRRRFFDRSMSLAVVEGSFIQKDDLLIIESTINGFRGIFIFFVVLVLVSYVGFIVAFIFSDIPGNMEWFMVPFIFIHASIMLGIPYFTMRRGVSKMKYDLERDFHYMVK